MEYPEHAEPHVVKEDRTRQRAKAKEEHKDGEKKPGIFEVTRPFCWQRVGEGEGGLAKKKKEEIAGRLGGFAWVCWEGEKRSNLQ